MDEDQLTDLIEQAFEDYVRELDDLNDIDARDLAENITRIVLEKLDHDQPKES